MDYRMEHREHQQFLTLVRAFPNEISGDDNDHSISDFWAECYEKNLIQTMKSILTTVRAVCSVSYGFLLRKIERLELGRCPRGF